MTGARGRGAALPSAPQPGRVAPKVAGVPRPLRSPPGVGAAAASRAAAFDPGHPRPASPDSRLDDVFSTPDDSLSWFSVSDTGTSSTFPATRPGHAGLGRSGRHASTPIAERRRVARGSPLSPDGTTARPGPGTTHCGRWSCAADPEPSDPRRRGQRLVPVWSRDGTRIIFGSNRGGDWDLYSAPAAAGPGRRGCSPGQGSSSRCRSPPTARCSSPSARGEPEPTSYALARRHGGALSRLADSARSAASSRRTAARSCMSRTRPAATRSTCVRSRGPPR